MKSDKQSKIIRTKFSPRFFKDNFPEWKRRKDPIMLRLIYRPISFYTASFCAKYGLSANSISYASSIVAVIASILFVFPQRWFHVIGGILISVWMIMDCTDGNLARSIRKQPYGEFADAMSSYILVGLMCTCMGVCAFFEGGLLISKHWTWIIFIGALASSSDSMMRLLYNKFKNTEVKMGINESINPTTEKTKMTQIREFVDEEFGLSGILPPFILICAIGGWMDIVVFYCFFYFGFSFVFSAIFLTKKAIDADKNHQ